MAFFFFMFAMVKAIVPRYRYDQLMRIGWKVFLPLSLGWVVIVAFLAKFELLGGLGPLGDRGLSMTQIDWTRATRYFLLMRISSRASGWG
jgi:ABC-type polysaccharide transport system permease subunit